MVALILAAGVAKRFGGIPKGRLLAHNGETLVERIARMLPTKVVHLIVRNELDYTGIDIPQSVIGYSPCTCYSLDCGLKLVAPEKSVAVLLADCFYSQWAITELTRRVQGIAFIGTDSEIHGLRFSASKRYWIEQALKPCVDLGSNGLGRGRLRDLFLELQHTMPVRVVGAPAGQHSIDFDHPADYHKWLLEQRLPIPPWLRLLLN